MNNRRPVRIANCSGFYGDRVAAAWEVLEGGDVDVLTGDYLAELTMLILWKARQKDASGGYAKTFLSQMERVMGTCLDRGIKVVSNAGGLNPEGLTDRLHELAATLGLSPRIAWIEGDDLTDRLPELVAAGHPLTHLDTGKALADSNTKAVTANAYLGAWGIVDALRADADIVVCPRVTDASLVVGPAAWWHGWDRTDYDALAGAVAAGHVIECGPQATGGNYSRLPAVPDKRRPGFPIAEVAADGQVVITKQVGSGGHVSPGTVTAQLLYEIQSPAYANPDVVAHFDTLRLEQQGPDRVLISGATGTAPPPDLKVAINQLGGYRNTMTLVLTGLDIEAKADWARAQLFDVLGGEDTFDEVDVRLLRFDRPDAETNEQATAHLRVTVKSADKNKVGRRFANATMELAVGGYAGFHTTTPPADASAYGVYWPTLVPLDVVTHSVVLPDGTRRVVPHGPTATPVESQPVSALGTDVTAIAGETRRVPLGTVCSARSGDKGGNANVGIWTEDERGFAWLDAHLTVERFRELLPEAADLEIRRWALPRLNALNFVVVGLLGAGVAETARPDPQAKGLGEYLRSRHVDVPVALIELEESRR
ncbi:acyclic terpene utilization AtuA family protein [Nocardioides sp. Soil796]|uniref:acyclic terpene utilization AtuA family protein n=1 Tax=Nocardioides sp. Soil796 TaxID=1736412 RepID=UPI000710D5B2|nr:acyclic terpene utilization AtuA family protein [Nocardioides sp. Soil796]KRF11861.1 exopolyphosphatase [Nocardioides sp. Soil796]